MGTEAGEERAVRGLRRRLWIERVIFVLAIAAVLAFHYGKLGGRRACLIAIDGKPTAVVASRSDADRLIEEVKKSAGVAASVSFNHKITFHSVSTTGQPVLPDAAAMTALSQKLQPVIQASAIVVNGELVIGLPSRSEALQALSSLLRELSPPIDGVQSSFKESVKIEAREVPPDRFAPSASAAVERIMRAAAPKGSHEVRPGETGWKIALDYHVPISRLAAANAGVDMNRIRAGDKLKIPGELPPVTVVARQDTKEEIAPGVSKTVRITYENGVEVSRDVVARDRPVKEPGQSRRRHRSSKDLSL